METQLTNSCYCSRKLQWSATFYYIWYVTMLDGLKVTKTADKMVWADGVLTYTITVTNSTAEIFTLPVITDVLDKTLVTFVDGSVTIDGQPAATEIYSYDEASGKLTINLSNIAPSASSTITFQVKKTA